MQSTGVLIEVGLEAVASGNREPDLSLRPCAALNLLLIESPFKVGFVAQSLG